jgi:hypothetical protein
MPLNPIGQSNLLHSLKTRYVRLRTIGEEPLLQPTRPFWPEAEALNDGGPEVWSNLAEFNYSLRYPLNWNRALQFTPLAEVALHSYTSEATDSADAIDSEGARVALGFDLRALIQGDFEVESAPWNIYGLRHIVEPLIQGRVISATGETDLSQVFPTFTSTRTDLDLITRRDRPDYEDELYVIRSGVSNTLIARQADGETRSLADLGLYYDTAYGRGGEQVFSSGYLEFATHPAPWLELSIDRRFDFTDGNEDEMRLRMTLRSAEAWELGFAVDFLDDRYDQYRAEALYHLDSRRALLTSLRFDALRSSLTEQIYGIRYRLGRSWVMEAAISLRDGAEREDDFSFSFKLGLLDF